MSFILYKKRTNHCQIVVRSSTFAKIINRSFLDHHNHSCRIHLLQMNDNRCDGDPHFPNRASHDDDDGRGDLNRDGRSVPNNVIHQAGDDDDDRCDDRLDMDNYGCLDNEFVRDRYTDHSTGDHRRRECLMGLTTRLDDDDASLKMLWTEIQPSYHLLVDAVVSLDHRLACLSSVLLLRDPLAFAHGCLLHVI